MSNQKPLFSLASFFVLSAFAFGCSSARDVEVTGSVQSELSGPIEVQIFEVTDDSEADAEAEPVVTIRLDQPGDLQETVSLEGDKLRAFALQDIDGDGQCSEGDAWAETTVQILEPTDDDGAPDATILLNLASAACP